jgi:Uri superfamily endonuclease
MRLDKRAHLAVGRLGRFVFPAGYYVYAGSAQGPGGLPARLARHRRREKRHHWHVDYLLARARLVEVWTVVSSQRLECAWAEAVTGLPGAQVLVPRFGASDCRCPAHLVYFPRPPAAGRMTATLQRPAGQAVTVRHHVETRKEEKSERGREKSEREEERHEKDAGDQAGWLRALSDGDEDAREEAAYALGALGAASVPPLLELLEEGDADVRCWAMWALAHTGSREAVQPLMAGLDEADDEVRTCAAMALGELRAAEAAPALVAQLEGSHGLLVRCAADALEKIGEEAVPDLVKALAHPKSQVRMWAARALGRIGSTAAVEPLCHVYLYDDSYLAQHYAEEALRDMGLLDIVLLA